MEVLREAQPVATDLQGADRFLQRLLVRLPDAHDLADRAHLRPEAILHPLELLEGPPGELDHDVVPGRGVLLEGSVAPVGDLVEGQPAGEKGGDEGDGEAGRLGREGRGAGGARVDLDHHHPSRLRVVGELDIRPPDHLDGVDDIVRVFLELVLEFRGDGQHGSRAEGIPGVDPHGVDVLDETDGDLLPLGVPDDFQLELLPAEDRLLDEDLADEARGEAPAHDRLELLQVVDEPAAGSPHGVGGSHHDGEADPPDDLHRLLEAAGDVAPWDLDPEAGHGVLELLAVLAALGWRRC